MTFVLSLKYPQKLGTIEWSYGHVRQVVINEVQTYQQLKLLRKFSEELWGSPICHFLHHFIDEETETSRKESFPHMPSWIVASSAPESRFLAF